MLTRWLTYLSFACFGLLSLMVLQMTKRPLCIDSRVVERIDRLTEQTSESIYRCAVNKDTPYSEYFGQQIHDLTSRIQNMERVLENIEPFYKRVQITIMEDRPWLYRIQGHQLFIGKNLVEVPGHIEKALAKIWYQERSEILFAQESLLEEVISDFLVYLEQGDLDIGDPHSHLMTSLINVKWPYVLKSVADYCESPWKQSEHFAICQNLKEAESDLSAQVMNLSLRPLLATSWIKSYMQLSMRERNEFVRRLPNFLHSSPASLSTLQAVKSAPQNSLVAAAEAIRNISAYISNPELSRDSSSFKSFIAQWTNELRASGFRDAFAEASFDVLLVSQEPLVEDSRVFEQFQKISKQYPKLQLALRDSQNLWLLPSRYPIPLSTFGQIKANRTIVEKCGGYNFSYVMDYADVTEKLLVVDHCDNKKAIGYQKYLTDGAEGFAMENKTVAFIQFHLPSLLMKRAELQQVANVFDFIKQRDLESASFKSLGWREVRWSQLANAYQPKAFVDAIEWFRVPGQSSL